MKKIIITNWGMEIGGVERSLIGLLNAIDYKEYEVDLFLCKHCGDFLDMIPHEVNLLPEIKQYTMFQKPIKDVICQGGFRIAYKRLISKFISRNNKKLQGSLLALYTKESLSIMPMISNIEYDLAISFLTPHFFTAERVVAKKKIAWIHTDYAAIEIDKELEEPMWNQYDCIAGISNSSVEAFNTVFPKLKNKTTVIENILSSKFVIEQSDMLEVSDEVVSDSNIIKICTVGRFCDAKAYDNCILICRKLIDRGFNIKWYVIGYGSDEEMMRNMIKQYHLEEYFVILGKKDNPYPYMKACDIYMQLSRYEGKSVAVTEAKMLCKPAVITNFSTAVNHLEDGVDGIIVPMELELCTDAIEEFLKNNDLQQSIIEHLKTVDFSNTDEVEKIYQLVE